MIGHHSLFGATPISNIISRLFKIQIVYTGLEVSKIFLNTMMISLKLVA